MNKLKCQVITLPQHQQKEDFTLFGKTLDGQLLFTNTSTFGKITPYHLYLISERGSSKGDWTVFPMTKNGKVISYDKPTKTLYNYASNGIYNFKVEATTNKSLNLPLIPESFIEEYVDAKGGKCEVWIEMEEYKDETSAVYTTLPNYIVITTPPKNSWNKEEIKNIAMKAWEAGYAKFVDNQPPVTNTPSFEEWFEQNY